MWREGLKEKVPALNQSNKVLIKTQAHAEIKVRVGFLFLKGRIGDMSAFLLVIEGRVL